MARNGSGTYNLPQSAFVYDTVIDETKVNSNFSDIADALTASISKDGQTTPTANLPMGGFKLTGLADGSAKADSAALGQIQGGTGIWCGTAGGTANAITLSPTPAITAYAAGQRFEFKAGAAANSGAVTFAISGLSTIAGQVNGAACAGGEIAANQWYRLTLTDANTAQIERVGKDAGASGDVTGPGSSTANYVPQWNGTDGKTLKAGLAVGTAANNIVQLDASAKMSPFDINAAQTVTKPVIGSATALTSSGGSTAVNLALANNFTMALTENTTLANPTNIVAGQSGCIAITQHASAAKTVAYGSYWIEATSGTAPSVSTTTSAQNLLSYYVFDTTHIYYTLNKHGVA